MREIAVSGGNLFRIAMEELGDATQWIRIAQLNNLADPMLAGPMLSGVITLRIPAIDLDAGGGIAAQ